MSVSIPQPEAPARERRYRPDKSYVSVSSVSFITDVRIPGGSLSLTKRLTRGEKRDFTVGVCDELMVSYPHRMVYVASGTHERVIPFENVAEILP